MSYLRRREFLSRALMTTAASAAFGAIPMKLALAQNIAGARLLNGSTDYKALVCIYLYGGNDSANMVIPRDAAGYADYSLLRRGNQVVADPSNLAIPLTGPNSLAVNPLNPSVAPIGGGLYSLHPAMTGTKAMFDAGRAAIVANVGPLVRPITKTMYQTAGTLLPAQLFSHSDQSVLWQTPRADATDRTGWGGRLADVFRASNTNQVLSMNVSLDGDNVFQSGVSVAPYFMNVYGVEQIDSIQTPAANCGPTGEWNRRRCLSFNALQNLAANATPGHAFERAYVRKTQSAIATAAQVAVAIAMHPENDVKFRAFWDAFNLAWTANSTNLPELPYLARQLLMVARVIASRATLNMQKQLFFAAIGGFDTHDNQNADHPELLRDLSQSVFAFYQVLDILNASESVTAFTASDFGRTLTSNGDGTDHGWGSHHLVFGSKVNGNRIYGKMPSLKPPATNPDDAGYGQIIPTLSTDQYAATLATWYGLPDADRSTIFPNLTFMGSSILSVSGPSLGFMQAP
jgi:uncharacterized protein (DUF1501 family)